MTEKIMSESNTKRKGIFLSFHQLETLFMLTPEQQEKLLLACYAYHKGEEPDLSDVKVAFAFKAFKPDFDAATAHYQKICKARRAAADARWKSADGKQTDANAYKCNALAYQEQVQVQEQEERQEEKKYTPPPPASGGRAVAGKSRRLTGNSKPELQAAIAAFTENQELRDALEAFRVMRERQRKPLTGDALRLTLRELDKHGATDAEKIAMLEQSIQRGWQGVFPVRQEARASPGQPVKSWQDREFEAAQAAFLAGDD